MSLYHGTSAGAALKILEEGAAPSANGFLYCFNGDKPESMAGALCFATGDKLRAGVIDTRHTLSQYYALNPDFPKGMKGMFFKAAMKTAINSWIKDQKKLPAQPHADKAAIIVFKNHTAAIHVEKRGGFVNEVKIPTTALPQLEIEKAYIDDSLLQSADVQKLKKSGIIIEPLSAWAYMIDQQSRPNTAPPRKGSPKGP